MRALLVLVVACSSPARPVHNAVPEPTHRDCPTELATAEAKFRHDAPAIYPDYAELGWSFATEQEDGTRFTITPGRTWSFSAGVYADGELELPITSDTWTKLPAYDAAYGRRAGDFTLAIVVETERSAVTPVAKHPLVVAFVNRMEAALDRCVN